MRRFWQKYVHVSRQFQSLFPALCSQFPDVLSLGSEAAAKLISPNAACAFRALSRIEASESAVGATRSSLLRDQDRPLRHLQHVRPSISEDAAHELFTEAITEATTPPILATRPCTYPIVVTPPPCQGPNLPNHHILERPIRGGHKQTKMRSGSRRR